MGQPVLALGGSMIASVKRVLREARELAMREPESGTQDSLYDLAVLAVILINLVWIMFGGPLS
jgi:hypothetical protein